MSTKAEQPPDKGVAAPSLSVTNVVTEAQGLWLRSQKSGLRLSALLRLLWQAGAHKQAGFAQFGEWCENTFPGMSSAQARQLSRQGAVILELEDAGRLTWSGESAPDRGVPATRGARALAPILFKEGAEVMVAVYDDAMHLAQGAPCHERHVEHAYKARRVPRDEADPKPPSPEPDLDDTEVETLEEHSVLLDALAEVESKAGRVQDRVYDEQELFDDIRLGRVERYVEFFDELSDAVALAREAWGALVKAVEAVETSKSPE